MSDQSPRLRPSELQLTKLHFLVLGFLHAGYSLHFYPEFASTPEVVRGIGAEEGSTAVRVANVAREVEGVLTNIATLAFVEDGERIAPAVFSGAPEQEEARLLDTFQFLSNAPDWPTLCDDLPA